MAASGPDITFLSAADQTYSRTLLQLLLSARRHGYAEGRHHWIAYDLGMQPATRAKLEARFPWCEFRTLPLSELPPHFAPKRFSYAWKPYIAWEVAEGRSGLLCWMDSANIVKGNLATMFDRAARTGFFGLHGQTAMLDRCDPLVIAKAGMPRVNIGTREVVAGLLCFDVDNPVMRQLLRRWRDLAFDEDAIRPVRLTTWGHVNDQALLSCLLFSSVERGELELALPDVDISSPRPISFVSTRNKMPHWVPAWADPLIRAYYGAAKFLDQRAHRIDRWASTMDIFRWRKERFAVFLKPRGASKAHSLPAPWRRYYADPFVWTEEGRNVIFFEDYSYLARRAKIAVVECDHEWKPLGGAKPVLDPGCHASFPFLFRHRGDLFMMPETWQAGGIDLYRCERFPDRWRRVRRILDKVDAADSVVFPHQGRWWLITSMTSPNNGISSRFLAIFSADDPVDGTWKPHPVNSEILYMDAGAGTGRNAGPVIARDGRLFRPMQKSARYYGEGAQIMEIVELSPERYREQPALPPYPFRDIIESVATHHVSMAPGVVCWDVRTVHPLQPWGWKRSGHRPT